MSIPVIFRNRELGRPSPPFTVRAVDPEGDASRDTILVEIRQGRVGVIREEAAHAAVYVVHGIAPKDVRITPDGSCDLGIACQPESFVRLVSMPSVLAGPMMALGKTLMGDPWPLPFDCLDPNHPSAVDVQILGSLVQQLELTEADYLQACDRARAITQHPAFRFVWNVLCEQLDRHEALDAEQIKTLFGLGDFTSWRQWYGHELRPPARVLEPARQEVLAVRIPHSLYDKLPLGVREQDTGEMVTFAMDGTDAVITDVLGKSPVQDLNSVLVTTSPDGTGQRVEIDSAGVRLIDADDEVIANLPTDETQDPSFAGFIDAAGVESQLDGIDQDQIRWRDDSGVIGAIVRGVTGLAGFTSSAVEIAAEDRGGTTRPNVTLNVDSSEGPYVRFQDAAGVTTAAHVELDWSDGWQDWTPSFTGWSSSPSGGVYRYKQTGKLVHLLIRQPNTGTSNAITKTLTLPVTAATVSGAVWSAPAAITDNGTAQTTWGRGIVSSGGSTVSFLVDAALGGFTASGAASIRECQITYEAA